MMPTLLMTHRLRKIPPPGMMLLPGTMLQRTIRLRTMGLQ